jgi:hypothetical protein
MNNKDIIKMMMNGSKKVTYRVFRNDPTWDINGNYIESEIVNGKPSYVKEGWIMIWSPDVTPAGWILDSILYSTPGMPYYQNTPGGETPDVGTWTCFMGDAPAPTVTLQT